MTINDALNRLSLAENKVFGQCLIVRPSSFLLVPGPWSWPTGYDCMGMAALMQRIKG